MAAVDARFLEELRDALAELGVRYLFIGKGAAILHGFPDTTQDADIFVAKDPKNAERLIEALRRAGAEIGGEEADALRRGKDFVEIAGDFMIDVVHAPDGIEEFEDAWNRGRDIDGYPVCSLDDVIASKESAGRAKDRESLPRLRNFRRYLQQENRTPGRPLPKTITKRDADRG